MRTMFYGSCGIGGLARAEVTFSDGRRCDGTVWDVSLSTCDPKSKMMLNLPSCEQKRAGRYRTKTLYSINVFLYDIRCL